MNGEYEPTEDEATWVDPGANDDDDDDEKKEEKKDDADKLAVRDVYLFK